MTLFTISLEFDGGTYLRQVRARSYKDALKVWVSALEPKEVKGLGPASLKKLLQRIQEESPVPVSGLTNVWCSTSLLNGKLALINFFQTAE